jgi:hypothetical protein
MIDFIGKYWQWIIGAVLVPIVAAVIGALLKKSGRKQKVGDIHGNRNTIINGDIE